jgi:hypothetical protein
MTKSAFRPIKSAEAISISRSGTFGFNLERITRIQYHGAGLNRHLSEPTISLRRRRVKQYPILFLWDVGNSTPPLLDRLASRPIKSHPAFIGAFHSRRASFRLDAEGQYRECSRGFIINRTDRVADLKGDHVRPEKYGRGILIRLNSPCASNPHGIHSHSYIPHCTNS